ANISIFDLTPEQVGPVDVIYTDPPWGEGATKLFDTLRHRQGQGREGRPWESVIERLVTVSGQVGARVVMVEMGTKWAVQTARIMQQGGYGAVESYGVLALTGGKVREAVLLVGEPRRTLGRLPVNGLRGLNLVKVALGAVVRRGETVWDPFCGFCMTGRACQQLGHRFVGTEYNA